MPRTKEASAAPKKERLTLSQLASYDDILTDALVDHVCVESSSSTARVASIDILQVYFWTAIRKNRSKYNLTRGISEEDVTRILLHQVVVDKDVQGAEASLLQLPGLRKFHSALKSDREKEDFCRHMRKYISLWLPDCPFEVSTTNRYTIVTHEAAVTARRDIKRGESVKYLVGNLVAMTPEEEKDLDLTRRDFSIVMSSRKRTPSLFLGPARFANHDCNANARLVTRGSEGMQIVATRDICVDEEITVTYGDNYFGEANCECLCLTCEKAGRGTWAAAGVATYSILSSDEEGETAPARVLRSSTTERSPLREPSNSRNSRLETGKPHKRRKTEETAKEEVSWYSVGCGSLRASKKRAWADEGEDISKVGDRGKLTAKRPRVESSAPCAPLGGTDSGTKQPGSLQFTGHGVANSSSISGSKNGQPLSRARKSRRASPMADSIFDQLSAALKKKPLKSSGGATSRLAGARGTSKSTKGTVEMIELMPPTNGESAHPALQNGGQPVETPISSSDQDSLFDNTNPPISSPATTPRPSEEPEMGSKLATQPNVNCSDDDLSELDPKVELDDDSMTIVEKSPKRRRAPRGSKILPTIEVEDASLRIPGDYTRTPLLLGENGYQWPKTKKTGEDDDEERVMDHRTVHRFIPFSEERLLVKRGKGCIQAGSESRSSTEIDKRPVSRLRESTRGRKNSHLRATS
ncbi:MAG: hypothetical protein Q9177_003917 [Variospora cf. flavescens]